MSSKGRVGMAKWTQEQAKNWQRMHCAQEDLNIQQTLMTECFQEKQKPVHCLFDNKQVSTKLQSVPPQCLASCV